MIRKVRPTDLFQNVFELSAAFLLGVDLLMESCNVLAMLVSSFRTGNDGYNDALLVISSRRDLRGMAGA
jgi:hypothetical protein